MLDKNLELLDSQISDLFSRIKRLPDVSLVDNDKMAAIISNFKRIAAEYSLAVETRNNDSGIKMMYPDANEESLRRKLDELGRRWKAGLLEDSALFNMDGFYPNYTHQGKRILFVGREAWGLAGYNYIDSLYGGIKSNDIGGRSLNQALFHARQFYLAYAILNFFRRGKRVPFVSVPWAADMRDIFGRAGNHQDENALSGMSWAFMNLSKLSNETEDVATDPHRYRPFVSCPRNQDFLREEIELLEPDIMIGANVWDVFTIAGYDPNKCFACEGSYCGLYENPSKLNCKPIFIDCYHFSAVKNTEECFYNPVLNLVEKYFNIRNV